MWQRYVRWWLNDLPAVDGRLRFIFYMGILVLGQHPHSKSFFHSLEPYSATDPGVYTARGLLGAVGVTYVPTATVETLIFATMVACFLAAIGLFTRFSCVAAATGAFFLHGLFLDTNAGNRSWFIPLYSLIALCFTCKRDKWSVDHLIRTFLSRPAASRNGGGTLCETGFARKCLLVMVVAFYFASGLSKLFNAGFAWADGATLHYFSQVYDQRFTYLLSENPKFCAALSIGALFLEAGAVLAFVSPRWRLLFLVSWSLMHLGIRFTMGPWYISNIWCFILLVDWGATGRSVRQSRIVTMVQSIVRSSGFKSAPVADKPVPTPVEEPAPVQEPELNISSRNRGAVTGTSLLAVMTAVCVLQIEFWPLTNVDLYSAYFSEDMLASYPRADYRNARRAQQIARETTEQGRLRLAQKFLAYHTTLQLVDAENRALPLPNGVGVSTQKQWMKSVLMPVIVEDLISKPDGDISWNPNSPDNPASLFLKRILPVIRRNVRGWEQFDRVVLTYALHGSAPIIASAPIHESDQ